MGEVGQRVQISVVQNDSVLRSDIRTAWSPWLTLHVALTCVEQTLGVLTIYKNGKEVMEVLISLLGVIISRYVCSAKHHIVHLNYILFIFVNYISIKLGKELNNC